MHMLNDINISHTHSHTNIHTVDVSGPACFGYEYQVRVSA